MTHAVSNQEAIIGPLFEGIETTWLGYWLDGMMVLDQAGYFSKH